MLERKEVEWIIWVKCRFFCIVTYYDPLWIFYCFHNKLLHTEYLKTTQIIPLLTPKSRWAQLISLLHAIQCENQGIGCLASHLDASGREPPSQVSRFLAESSSCYRAEVPVLCWLLSWNLSQFLNVFYIPWFMAPFIFKTNNSGLISHIWISLTSCPGPSLRTFTACNEFMGLYGTQIDNPG